MTPWQCGFAVEGDAKSTVSFHPSEIEEAAWQSNLAVEKNPNR